MRRPGRVVAGAALALALAVTAAGTALAAPAGQPQKRHTPGDMAKARAIGLRAADLGPGWKSSPSGIGGGTPTCKGFDPKQSDLVQTGSAESPQFERGLRFVSSSVSVFKTAAQAQTSWNRIVRPQLVGCLGSIVSKGTTSATVKTTVVGTGAIPVPRLAPRTAAYRIELSIATAGTKSKGTLDLYLLGGGRVDALIISVSVGGSAPTADELRLARIVAGRI